MLESIENRHFDLDLMPANGLAFDCGAIHGKFAKRLSDRGFRVVAFEPDDYGYTTLPDLPLVTKVKKGIGYPAGTRTFYEFQPGSGANGLYLNEHEEKVHPSIRRDIEVITLSDAISEYGRPDLLKMNIEGAEIEVLMNEPDHVLSSIPQITVSFHAFCGFVTVDQENACKDRLMSLGFELKLFGVDPDGLPEDTYAFRR